MSYRSVVTVLEEPLTVTKAESRGADSGVREGRGDESCSVVVLFRETDLEESFQAAERTSRRGWTRGRGGALIAGWIGRSCTVVVLNRYGGWEEPSPAVEEGSRRV